MNSNNSLLDPSKPILLIDFKKSRIRVHRKTLQMLGSPDYIQFLVHPQNKIIAIRPTVEVDNFSHHIRWEELSSCNQCIEFYSKYFIRQLLHRLDLNISDEKSYRFYGSIHPETGVAYFSLRTPIIVDYLPERVQTNESIANI